MPHVPEWLSGESFPHGYHQYPTETAPATPENPWQKVLTEGHASLVRARRLFRYLPSAPRCKVCSNPFGGPAGRVLAAAGFTPSRKNPNLCSRCCDVLPAGGAEVDVAVLFADVRGSTALSTRSAATDFASLLNRFYIAATQTLLRHDAVIDKLIGDEVMAFFVRGISGPHYREPRCPGRDWICLRRSVTAATRNPGSSWAWRSMRASPTSATSGAPCRRLHCSW